MKLNYMIGILLAGGGLELEAASAVTITPTNYQGWADSYVLRNAEVEAIVVPAIGRVMQFRFIGEAGVFWENPAHRGRVAPASVEEWKTTDWVNFGGDKAWPSPEGSWNDWTRRATWRPPPAFDGNSYQLRVDGEAVVMTSQEDPFLGIQVTRRIELSGRTSLRITTEFEKRSGEAVTCGVWVVTQLNDPVRLFAPVPQKTIFTRGYILLSQRSPPSLKVDQGYVSLERDRGGSYKIGLDSERLLWIGEKHCLLIENPREPRQSYPDRGSSTEIYTNPDPLKYIELEAMGPLKPLKATDRLRESLSYHLIRRAHPTPEAEARAILEKK
jgi:hypothetical protein